MPHNKLGHNDILVEAVEAQKHLIEGDILAITSSGYPPFLVGGVDMFIE